MAQNNSGAYAGWPLRHAPSNWPPPSPQPQHMTLPTTQHPLYAPHAHPPPSTTPLHAHYAQQPPPPPLRLPLAVPSAAASPLPGSAAAATAATAAAATHLAASAHPGASPAPSAAAPGGTALDGLPDAPTRFAELEAMPLPELRSLQDERAKFGDFVTKLPHAAHVEDVLLALRTDVGRMEDELSARRAAALSLGGRGPDGEVGEGEGEGDNSRAAVDKLAERVAQLETETSTLAERREEWITRHSGERLMERLRVAIRESEAEAEKLERSMLASSIKFDTFLQEYIACKKTFHERALKLEQLKLENRSGVVFGR